METIEEIKQTRDYPYEIRNAPAGDYPTRGYTVRYDEIDSDDAKKAALIMDKFKWELKKYPSLSKEEASNILENIAREYRFDRIRLDSWG